MALFTLALVLALQTREAAVPPRPTMGEFMGVNGHTVQFRPGLYAPTCRKVRDYHSFEWDMGKDTDFVPVFPEARNRVNWNDVYGSWKKEGFETDVSIMFAHTPADSWKDLARDARAYGRAFAKAFGPSSALKLVSSAEVGNEPGQYPDERYRLLFENMALGLREGDPALTILTCNITAGKSGPYEKSVSCVAGLESLYDVLNHHTYALAEGWPTWRRSFPEDPKIEYLKTVLALIDWRNQKARGKPIWITEFGYDASTKPAPKTGDFSKWEGVTDLRQAQYLVRSFLVFSAMDVRRAYLYFFNDSDEPAFHGSSGITRNFEPKPSYHALSHLYRSLRDFRLGRVLAQKPGDLYVYEYVHKEQPKRTVWVAWSPTGSDRKLTADLPAGQARLVRAEGMPFGPGEAPAAEASLRGGILHLELTESPLYAWLEE
jgi:serine/threonine-protein kinase ATR